MVIPKPSALPALLIVCLCIKLLALSLTYSVVSHGCSVTGSEERPSKYVISTDPHLKKLLGGNGSARHDGQLLTGKPGSRSTVAGHRARVSGSRNFRMRTLLPWIETQDLRCKRCEALCEGHLWVWGMQTQSLEDFLSGLFSHLWTTRNLATEQQQSHI